MDVEIHNFIKVWSAAVICQFYCYFAVSRIPAGLPRLLSVLPVIYLFTTLPLALHSFHLGGATFFYLVWLANSKLLLFSFNLGPLSSPPLMSLSHFIAIALLPIKTKSTSTSATSTKPQSPDVIRRRRQFRIRRFLIKLAVFATVIRLYSYRQKLGPKFSMALYCCHLYFGVEYLLAVTTVPVKAVLRLELARQFNEPYLTTSLQDFWGRRWNLMVTEILRQAVYDPTREFFTPIIGRSWSLVPGNMVAFLISGLMHELLVCYFCRAGPTWEVTWFFMLHGICVTCEVYVKKWVAGRWRLHRAVAGLLTVGFVGVTCGWLFFPPLVRHRMDFKVIEECYVFLRFVKNCFVLST